MEWKANKSVLICLCAVGVFVVAVAVVVVNFISAVVIPFKINDAELIKGD